MGGEAQPPFHGEAQPFHGEGDKLAYEKSLAIVYRGLFDAGLQTDILSPVQLRDACDDDPARLVTRWQVLVGISLYVISDADLDFLRRYVEAGGHLVWTPRSGMADEEAIVRGEVMPGALRDVAGVRYEESTSLLQPVPVTSLGGHGQWYAHCLIPEGAETIAGYDHPFLADYAAVTSHRHGKDGSPWWVVSRTARCPVRWPDGWPRRVCRSTPGELQWDRRSHIWLAGPPTVVCCI